MPGAADTPQHVTDGFHTYNWDAEGRLQHIEFDSSTWTYDALGRPVEKSWTASSPVQLIYAPQGNLFALMNGQTLQTARLPLPGGVRARYVVGQSLPTEYQHPDWLGTSRLASDAGSRSVTHDVAFAPFGEQYVSTSLFDSTFTGVAPHDKAPDLYDFAAREYHPTQGRWISPDPAGLAAVDMTDPQTLNRYGYVRNNPLALIDPSGLDPCENGIDPVTGNICAVGTAAGGSDSFLYQIYFAWYYGYGNRPNSGGGGVGTSPQKSPTKPGRQLSNCAADFGNSHSLAAGLEAITGGLVSKNNFVVSTLLGNDVSAISDILTGRNPLSAGVSEFFSNPSPWNVVALGVRAVGSLPSGGAPTATLGENSAGQVFVRTWNPAKIAGTAAFEGASKALAAFTVAKLALDLGTFAVGTVVCQQ